MSYFAPNLIPEHHMHTALISPEDFYKSISKLNRKTALNLIYVRDSDAVMVAPLYRLSEVDIARIKARESNPELAKYLSELTERWVKIIAMCAIEHPFRCALLQGIHTALVGDLPEAPPWTLHFDRTLITGDDNQIYLPPKSRLCDKKGGAGWGLSSEPAADLLRVMGLLGYGKPEKIALGRPAKKKLI